MRDICEHHFFIRDGRDAVQSWIGSIQDHSQILAVVPVFQPELTLEANIANLSDAGYIEGKWWHQRCYIYSGDDAILVLVTSASYRKIFEAHLAFVASKYHQKGYIVCSDQKAELVTEEGRFFLPDAFYGSLEEIDKLAATFIPGFKTTGHFDRSMSYVQMRDYQTRPK